MQPRQRLRVKTPTRSEQFVWIWVGLLWSTARFLSSIRWQGANATEDHDQSFGIGGVHKTGQATCKFWNVYKKGVIMQLAAVCLRYTCKLYIYITFTRIKKHQETASRKCSTLSMENRFWSSILFHLVGRVWKVQVATAVWNSVKLTSLLSSNSCLPCSFQSLREVVWQRSMCGRCPWQGRVFLWAGEGALYRAFF